MLPTYCARHPMLGGFAVVAALVAVAALNQWLFARLWSTDYLRWYAHAGPFIALATGAFGAAWGGLDRNPRLVSAHPCVYLSACFQVAGLPIYAFGTHFRNPAAGARVPAWEIFAAIPLVVVFVIAAIGWLVFIVPLQYFVFVICGAPVRIAMRSRVRVEARFQDQDLAFVERAREQPLPEGWWDASMRDKPVTLTSAFAAALLFLLQAVW